MADFTVEAKRVKSGQALIDINNQAISAINRLKTIKINVLALKTEVQNDVDFIEEDATAVQVVIDSLLAEIDSI